MNIIQGKYKVRIIYTRSMADICRMAVFGVLTFICMILIFRFSADNADRSSEKSGKVTKTVVEVAVPDYEKMPQDKQESILDKAEHIVRKCAHFSIFTALGFCASCTVGRRRIFGLKSLATLGFCFLYACSDEIHQLFIPGRSGMFTDVLIDTSGSLCGIIVSMLILALIGAMFKRKSSS